MTAHENTILYTERLILRPWEESDAESLYEYAKDERIGPSAGWPAHTSVENSREIIGTVLSAPETYAVCLKEDGKAIGAVGLEIGDKSNIGLPDDQGEIGYWVGVPFWGRGYIPEAVRELIRRAFADLRLEILWCGYFDGNYRSKRVMEKCGFTYHHTNKDIYWPATDDIRTEHVMRLIREEWRSQVSAPVDETGSKETPKDNTVNPSAVRTVARRLVSFLSYSRQNTVDILRKTLYNHR